MKLLNDNKPKGKEFSELGNDVSSFPVGYTNGLCSPVYIVADDFYYEYNGLFYTADEYFNKLHLN